MPGCSDMLISATHRSTQAKGRGPYPMLKRESSPIPRTWLEAAFRLVYKFFRARLVNVFFIFLPFGLMAKVDRCASPGTRWIDHAPHWACRMHAYACSRASPSCPTLPCPAVAQVFDWAPGWIFGLNLLGLIPLASLLGDLTEVGERERESQEQREPRAPGRQAGAGTLPVP